MSLFISWSASADSKLTLQEFVELTSQETLALKIEAAKVQSAQSAATGINLPPPMVSAILMRERDGSSATGFEVEQMVTFPSRLRNDLKARKFEASSREQMLSAARYEVRSQAKLVYISLWLEQERLKLLREKKAVLETHVRLSRAAVRSDSFLQIHLLNAESDQDLIESEIIASQQLSKDYQIAAAELVNVAPDEFRLIVEEPPLSELPRALPSTPVISALEFNLESLRAKEMAARGSWFPDLNLRYKQIQATNMMPAYSEVMVGVSLPFVYFWEPRAATESASANRQEADYVLQQSRRKIEIQRASLLNQAESLKKQLSLLNSKLLPRAERRMQLAHNLAPRDMETLQDHRETMEAFPDLKLRALDLRMQYERAIQTIEKYGSDSESIRTVNGDAK